jgi:Transposase
MSNRPADSVRDGRGNKDDRFGAYLLADVLLTDRRRLTPLTVDRPDTLGLRMLIRARHRSTGQPPDTA